MSSVKTNCKTSWPETAAEAERIIRICAACMYCDGLCPVFPALAGQTGENGAERSYLANLCHNCRACWHACQYAPPHPFAVNAPETLARVRRESYADYIWPPMLGRAFHRPALGAGFMLAATLLSLNIMMAMQGAAAPETSAFYAVAPWVVMAGLATLALSWAMVSLTVSTLRFWQAMTEGVSFGPLGPALARTLADIVTLRHLDGGGPGCHDTSIAFSRRRRIFHHMMAGGVVLAFAATLAAAFSQHVLSLQPPFALSSLPVALGCIGGVGIVLGAGGLLGLEANQEREPSERGESQLNIIFLIALELVALSGLALLIWRESAAMAPLLRIHVSLVVGLFAGLPVTKAIHAPFRGAALLRSALARPGRAALRRDAVDA